MIGMVICNCPDRCCSTVDFSPCSCCSSGEHTDPRCGARSLRLELIERLELAHPEFRPIYRGSRGNGRIYPPKWARRDRA